MDTCIGLFSKLDHAVDEKAEDESQIVFLDHSFTMEYQKLMQRLTTSIDVSQCMENAPVFRVEAIWDTGSMTSGISNKMARKIGLQPIDNGVGVTPAGQIEILYYYVDVCISQGIVMENVKIAGFPLENHDADFLIGMDIISKGNLSIINAKGKTIITFETA